MILPGANDSLPYRHKMRTTKVSNTLPCVIKISVTDRNNMHWRSKIFCLVIFVDGQLYRFSNKFSRAVCQRQKINFACYRVATDSRNMRVIFCTLEFFLCIVTVGSSTERYLLASIPKLI